MDCFVVRKNPTGVGQAPTSRKVWDFTRNGFQHKRFQSFRDLTEAPRNRVPLETVMVLTICLHATRRTQAALGEAGR